VIEVESPHPYVENMERYWVVEHPEAIGYSVSFHENTRTEPTYDYVQLLGADEAGALVFGEKFSGGFNNSPRLVPGLDGRPPLDIPAPRFRVLFRSDRSNQDWGFKLIATIRRREGGPVIAELNADNARDAGEAAVRDLNPTPVYLGQPPSYVGSYRAAQGLLGNVVRRLGHAASKQSMPHITFCPHVAHVALL
jgi:hypothetical protein